MADGDPQEPATTSKQARQPGVADASPEGQPDWDAIGAAAKCSRCGQDLRRSARPVCPRCGLAFHWPDLLEDGARGSEFLFEHHWRDRPVRSWLRTFWHGLRPVRFWQRVNIHDHIEPPGLWLALLSGPLVFLLTLNILLRPLDSIARCVKTTADSCDCQRVASVAEYAGHHLDDYLSGMLGGVRGTGLLLAAWVLIPLLLVIALAWLSGLIGGCRVRKAQMLRVVACSAGPVGLVLAIVLWATFTASALALGFHGMAGSSEGWTEWWMQPAVWPEIDSGLWLGCMVLLFLIPLVYLRAGLRHYLRVPHATRVVVAALAIVCVLVVLAVTRAMMISLQRYA